VGKAVASAKVAISAAGNVVDGVITGTASGVLTSKGKALIEFERAGTELVKYVTRSVESVQEAESTLDQLKSDLEAYPARLKRLESELTEKALEDQIRDIQRTASEKKQTLLARLEAGRNRIETTIRDYKDRAVAAFEVAEHSIRSEIAAFEADLEVIAAEIKGNDNEAGLERRKARQYLRRADVLRQKLDRLTLEYAQIDTGLAETNEAMLLAQEQRRNETRAALANLEDTAADLHAHLRRLEFEAQALIENRDASPIEPPVGELLTTVDDTSVSLLGQEGIRLLYEANRLVFQHANWLYLMTRDPQALRWAVTAGSQGELKIVTDRLQAIHGQMERTIGRAAPRYFVVRITPNALSTAESDLAAGYSPRLVFTVSPELAVFEQTAPESRDEPEDWIGDEPHSIYRPLPEFLVTEKKIKEGARRSYEAGNRQIVFAPYVESEVGAINLLWDVWVIPEWRESPPPN